MQKDEIKLAFVDTETTGLNVQEHEIIQIGCVLVMQRTKEDKTIEYEVLDEFELKVKPQHIEKADQTALRINGYNEADWVFAYTLPEALKIFSEKTKDAIMVAHNLVYDFAYLDKAFFETKVENKMHYHKLDTISIAYAKSKNKGDMNRFSLRSLCELFGIENKNAHTALSDCRATFELYKKLMQL